MNKRRWICWWAMVAAFTVMSFPAFGDVQVGLGCNLESCAGVWPPEVSAGFQTLSIGSATEDVWMTGITNTSGTIVTLSDGSSTPFLIADVEDVQTQYYPTPLGENNPNSGYTYSSYLIVTQVNSSYFNGAACTPGVLCGTGTFDANSIFLNQSASISIDLDLGISRPDPPPDPTPEPRTIVLWLTGGAFCGLVVKNRCRLARR